jgi:hypothetical protein
VGRCCGPCIGWPAGHPGAGANPARSCSAFVPHRAGPPRVVPVACPRAAIRDAGTGPGVFAAGRGGAWIGIALLAPLPGFSANRAREASDPGGRRDRTVYNRVLDFQSIETLAREFRWEGDPQTLLRPLARREAHLKVTSFRVTVFGGARDYAGTSSTPARPPPRRDRPAPGSW